AACSLQGAYGAADIQTHMRFEELAYRDGGQAVTIPFHRTMTVLGGLDADLRRRFADRTVASLSGNPAGYGVSLVFVDGSGSRVHLVRDSRGGTTVTDLDSGEDLADALAAGDGHIDWLRLVGLGSAELLLLDPAHFERDTPRPADGPGLGGARAARGRGGRGSRPPGRRPPRRHRRSRRGPGRLRRPAAARPPGPGPGPRTAGRRPRQPRTAPGRLPGRLPAAGRARGPPRRRCRLRPSHPVGPLGPDPGP